MQPIQRTLYRWLPLAALATGLCGLVYLAVQQVWRQAADDPQVQMARDAADRLAEGQPADSVLPALQVDIGRSLAPFVMVFDDTGAVRLSSGRLHGQVRTVPTGVLAYARQHGEERVTWQPAPGVRVATVVVRCAGASPGFVLVGRSLAESEHRTAEFGHLVVLAWLALAGGLLLLVAATEYMRSGLRWSGNQR